MDCQDVDFSPQKSKERINKAQVVFESKLLFRTLAFALYLLGAKRKTIAAMVDMPEESVKTAVRVVLRDGFGALRDRRKTDVPSIGKPPIPPAEIRISRDDQRVVLAFGSNGGKLSIPADHKIQLKTVLLSLFQSGLVTNKQAASVLGISEAHCRHLAKKLAEGDVEESLLDKRRGQKQDYLVGPAEKAEIIKQFTARVVTGLSVTSDVLAQAVEEHTQVQVSARTVRWHMSKLGFGSIKKTLPELVAALKKTSEDTRQS